MIIRKTVGKTRSRSNLAAKKALLLIVTGILVVSMMPLPVWANSAEPPSLVILVNDPPEDLSIWSPDEAL